jgi:hypothetical protein
VPVGALTPAITFGAVVKVIGKVTVTVTVPPVALGPVKSCCPVIEPTLSAVSAILAKTVSSGVIWSLDVG